MQDIVGEQTLDAMKVAKHYNNWIFDLIRPYLRGTVAEVGAGIGTCVKKVSALGFKTCAIDYNSDYLRKISDISTAIDVFPFDIQSQNLPRALVAKFDTVITLNVLEHVPDHTQAVKNIRDMSRAGGTVVILVPAFNLFYNNLDKNLGHVRRYSKASLEKILIENGFSIIKSRFVNPLGLLGWWIAGKFFNQRQIKSSQVKMFDILVRPMLFVEKYLPMPVGISLICVAKKI
ncbi:class I SAM-dependent methyltransferase [Candidatus Amesbacteria bacterium]|nr:class I SAM-dependent methyltransferase [Candidatus Amesbacteria bacterium]